MGAVSQDSEPSMEDILSSIRQIISDDEKSGQTEAALDDLDGSRELSQDDLDKLFDDLPSSPEEEAKPEPVPAKEPESSDVLHLTKKDQVDEVKPDLQMVEGLGEDDKGDDSDIAFLEEDDPMGAMMAAMQSQGAPEPVGAPEPSPRASLEDTLVSNATNQVVSSAFTGLANTVLSKNARTLEDLVADMLRPMLKQWLDQHLPATVERLVQQEIDRISGK